MYESVENPLTLDADSFEAYLEEEGLPHIVDARAERGESGLPGREVYVRCAKSLVYAGSFDGDGDGNADAPTGLPLEVVLRSNGAPRVDEPLYAVVLKHGSPAGGLRVIAVSADDPGQRIEAVTDPDGHVSFTPKHGGAWMLTTITMDRLHDHASSADWKSLWSSVTFEVMARPATNSAG